MELTGRAVAVAHPTLIQQATEAAVAAAIQHCAIAAPAANRNAGSSLPLTEQRDAKGSE